METGRGNTQLPFIMDCPSHHWWTLSTNLIWLKFQFSRVAAAYGLYFFNARQINHEFQKNKWSVKLLSLTNNSSTDHFNPVTTYPDGSYYLHEVFPSWIVPVSLILHYSQRLEDKDAGLEELQKGVIDSLLSQWHPTNSHSAWCMTMQIAMHWSWLTEMQKFITQRSCRTSIRDPDNKHSIQIEKVFTSSFWPSFFEHAGQTMENLGFHWLTDNVADEWKLNLIEEEGNIKEEWEWTHLNPGQNELPESKGSWVSLTYQDSQHIHKASGYNIEKHILPFFVPSSALRHTAMHSIHTGLIWAIKVKESVFTPTHNHKAFTDEHYDIQRYLRTRPHTGWVH